MKEIFYTVILLLLTIRTVAQSVDHGKFLNSSIRIETSGEKGNNQGIGHFVSFKYDETDFSVLVVSSDLIKNSDTIHLHFQLKEQAPSIKHVYSIPNPSTLVIPEETSKVSMIRIYPPIEALQKQNKQVFLQVAPEEKLIDWDYVQNLEQVKLLKKVYIESYDKIFATPVKNTESVTANTSAIFKSSEPCEEYKPCVELNPVLYAFIGKKLSVEYSAQKNYCNMISMDSKSKAKYQVIENIYGNYSNDTIEFFSYSHSPIIRYTDYEHVLIYVAKYCDELVHVKYQFDPVYKTKQGKWVSPVTDKLHTKELIGDLVPHKVDIAEPIRIVHSSSTLNLMEMYQEPHYIIKKGKVFMKYGFYPNELLEMKKKNLRSFGFFK